MADPDYSKMSDAELKAAIGMPHEPASADVPPGAGGVPSGSPLDASNTVEPVRVTAPRIPAGPPPKDWEKASWPEVLGSAAYNLPGSTVKTAYGMVEPFFPQNIPHTIETTGQLIGGGLSAGAGYLPQGMREAAPGIFRQDPASKAQNEALWNAMTHDYANRYGKGFKETLATNPASYVADVGMLAMPVEAGAGLVARGEGAVANAARTVGNVAKVAGTATNPFSLAGAGLKTVLPAPRAFASSGAMLPRVEDAIRKAYPNGEITAADFASPEARAALDATIREKGISPAAIRETTLRHLGADTPTTAVTGGANPVPASAAPAVRASLSDMERTAGNAATKISDATAPSNTSLGTALQDSHIAHQENTAAKYGLASQAEGEFHPDFQNWFGNNLRTMLKAKNFPTTAQEASAFPSFNEGSSVKAHNFVTGQLKALGDNGQLTMENLERVRQELNTLGHKTSGNDAHSVSTMKDALDKTMEDALEKQAKNSNANVFNGDAGTTTQALKEARKANGDFFGKFSDASANPAVKSAVKAFAGQKQDNLGFVSRAPAGSEAVAHNILSKNLIDPKSLISPPQAERLYNDLSDIFDQDGRQAMDEHIRQSVLRLSPDGTLAAHPDAIHNFLKNSPLSDVFSSQEKSQIRMLAEADRMATTSFSKAAERQSGMLDAVGEGAKTLGTLALGAGTGAVTGVPFMPSLMNYGRQQFENAMRPSVEAAALSGAPKAGGLRYFPGRAAGAISTAARPVGTAGTILNRGNQSPASFKNQEPAPPAAPQEQAPQSDNPYATMSDEDLRAAIGAQPRFAGGRVGRASGGKISDVRRHEYLVNRLLTAAKDAKKATDKATETLLNVPDEHIVKALDVAQRAI